MDSSGHRPKRGAIRCAGLRQLSVPAVYRPDCVPAAIQRLLPGGYSIRTILRGGKGWSESARDRGACSLARDHRKSRLAHLDWHGTPEVYCQRISGGEFLVFPQPRGTNVQAAACCGLAIATRQEAGVFLPVFLVVDWWLGKSRRDATLIPLPFFDFHCARRIE